MDTRRDLSRGELHWGLAPLKRSKDSRFRKKEGINVHISNRLRAWDAPQRDLPDHQDDEPAGCLPRARSASNGANQR